MIVIITILVAILILNQIIIRKLITKLNIEESELNIKYVNKNHINMLRDSSIGLVSL